MGIGGLVIWLMLICVFVGLNGEEEEELRLPKFAIPKHYSIRLQPDLIYLKFNGSVEIEVEIVEKTDRLILNTAGLDVLNIYFRSKQKMLLKPVKIEMDAESERLVLKFSVGLPIGLGVLGMNFFGNVSSAMEGLFWRTYTINGEERNMLATQFESIYARRCFPCWDEPAFKATFTVTLDVPSHLMALSNMPVSEEKTFGLVKTVSFKKSPLMSTYLVAIVIGEFDHVEGHTSDGIKVRIYCPIGRASEAMLALKLGIRALDIYKEYLSTPFALPKLDMVAIPDFPQGMENYGLIIFGESLILHDDQSSGVDVHQKVAEVVAHEIAHQWFGNLVTLEWWSDVWLNEAFATWLSYTALDSIFPKWDPWFRFVMLSESTLLEDASADTHPVVVKINHFSEIDNAFDEIVYQKGAHLIRMLNAYLGPETFQQSMVQYIKKHAWSNTRTGDLWTVLEKVSGLPVHNVMNTWVRNKGFPVVSVKINLHILQLSQTQINAFNGDTQWVVPIRICCGGYDACHDIVLHQKNETFDLREYEGCSCASVPRRNETCPWRKINVNRTGFYRVVYEENLVSELQHAVESKHFSTSDRFALLTDSYQPDTTPRYKLTSLLSLMSAYSKEDDNNIVSRLTTRSEAIVEIASDATPGLVGCVKRIFIGVFESYTKKIGWEAKLDERYADKFLRTKILHTLAVFGHKGTLNEAKRRFHAFLADKNTSLFPYDIRRAAYVAVMQTVSSSKSSDFISLMNIIVANDSNWSDIYGIRETLTASPNPDIVIKSLNFLFSPKVLRHDGAPPELEISWGGREVAWTWFKEKWGHLDVDLSGYYDNFIHQFASTKKAAEVKDFFAHHQSPSLSKISLRESIDRILLQAKWVRDVQKETNLPRVIKKLSREIC